jgi:hypothetical protein
MQDIRVRTGRSAELGDNRHVVEVVPIEFRSLMSFYPIVISKDPATDQWMFVTICGFEPGENLLLGDDGWNVPYVPLNIRRQPFNVIATEGTTESGETVRAPALAIDLDNPRVNKEEGERLFDDQGEATPFLEEVDRIMSEVVPSTQRARQLAQRLGDEGLIESLTINFELADGEKHSVTGLYAINENKFRELPEETILDMHRQGQLGSIYAMIASMGQLGGLLELKSARPLA